MQKYYQSFLDEPKGMDIGGVTFLARNMAMKGIMDEEAWGSLLEFEAENSKNYKLGWESHLPADITLWKMVYAVGIKNSDDAQELLERSVQRGYVTEKQANAAITATKSDGEFYLPKLKEIKPAYDQEAAVKKHAAQIAAAVAAEEGSFIPHHDSGTWVASQAQTIGGVKPVEGLEPVAGETQVPWYTTVDEVSTGAAKAGGQASSSAPAGRLTSR